MRGGPGENHVGLSAEFRTDPRRQYIATDLRIIFYPAYLREVLRARGARVLCCGKVQAAGGMDVHRLRNRDFSRHRTHFRDPAGRGRRARFRAFARCRRRGVESDQGQVAVEYRRL